MEWNGQWTGISGLDNGRKMDRLIHNNKQPDARREWNNGPMDGWHHRRTTHPGRRSIGSMVSAIPAVWEWLLPANEHRCRRACGGGGRDIGTRVFPEADVKVFPEADAEVRAKTARELVGPSGSIPDQTARPHRAWSDRGIVRRAVARLILRPCRNLTIMSSMPVRRSSALRWLPWLRRGQSLHQAGSVVILSATTFIGWVWFPVSHHRYESRGGGS